MVSNNKTKTVKKKGTSSPIIVGTHQAEARGAFENAPEWLRKDAETEQLLQAFSRNILTMRGEKEPEEAGDAETCLYLYTLTLHQPVEGDVVAIYTHLIQKLLERKGGSLPPSTSEKYRVLTPAQEKLLADLKHDIYVTRGPAHNPISDMLEKMAADVTER